MTVALKFYNENGTTEIDPALGINFGNLYKGQEKIMGITIKNVGDTDAVMVRASVEGTDKEAKDWKKLSLSRNGIYAGSVEIPDIPAGQFMPGYSIYASTFSVPENDWVFTNDQSNWEFYTTTKYLHHKKSASAGRALAPYPVTMSSETQLQVSIPSDSFGGIQLRADGNGHGYFILINTLKTWIDDTNWKNQSVSGYVPIGYNEGVVQIWTGALQGWNVVYTFPTGTGPKSVGDKFKVKLEGSTFEIWYNDKRIGEWTDQNDLYNRPGKLALIAGPNVTTVFDELEHSIKGGMGVLYIKDSVSIAATPKSHNTILRFDYAD